MLIFATVWYAMREVSRAEAAMEVEYNRSEALLANILPASVAARLKDPAHGTIADRYDDASILFADIAGFTERASQIPPTDLVRFLDRLYTTFDRLVDGTAWRRSRPPATPTWWSAGFPSPAARPRRGAGTAGPGHVAGRWPNCATPRGAGAAADGYGRRPGGGRGGGRPAVLL